MKKYIYILSVFALISCKENSQQKKDEFKQPAMSIVHKHTPKVLVNDKVKKEIESWEEYKKLDEKMTLFYAISGNEAKNNALDLAKIIKSLKNSEKPIALNTLSFTTRINVLQNEILRLEDMTFIPSITADEVNSQVQKIIAAFSATNSKINAVYITLQIDKEIEIKE